MDRDLDPGTAEETRAQSRSALERISAFDGAEEPGLESAARVVWPWERDTGSEEWTEHLAHEIAPHLLANLPPELLDPGREDDLRSAALELLERELAVRDGLPEGVVRERFARAVLDSIIGLGPLQPLLEDEQVSEVMVNGPGRIYVERRGKLHRAKGRFAGEPHLRRVVDRVLNPVNRHVDEETPLADARLRGGARFHVVVPPIALNGTCVTIRKFRSVPVVMDDLLRQGGMSPSMARYLEAAVRCRLNLMVVGGSGSGKTTLLNVLSAFIPEDQRIITVEDTAELRLQQPHVVRLEARQPNTEGQGAVTIRDLVRNCLRMRPDRLLVGECRGAEAFDMLLAMNTGHEGSMTTLHANSPREALQRLEVLVLMSGMDLPEAVIRDQIAASLNIVVQIVRLPDGKRRIVSISEVTGREHDEVLMQEVFRFLPDGGSQGRTGAFEGCGALSVFHARHEVQGCALPPAGYEERWPV